MSSDITSITFSSNQDGSGGDDGDDDE